jgi:hypothetical protein
MYQEIIRLTEGTIISSWQAVTSAGQKIELAVEPNLLGEDAGSYLVEVDPEQRTVRFRRCADPGVAR